MAINQVVTFDILDLVFRICLGCDVGTAFAIEVDERQYIVTAKHLTVPGHQPTSLEIDYKGRFRDIPCRFVGYGEGDSDVVVLAASQQLAPGYPTSPSRAGLGLSQDVYFLGFPYNMGAVREEIGTFFPMPLVKKAITSGSEPGRYGALYLDCHNNSGFSGGPIVSRPNRKQDLQICAVVSGFRTEDVRALKGTDEDVTDLIVRLNTGIIIAYPIDVAIEAIRSDPIGFLKLMEQNTV